MRRPLAGPSYARRGATLPQRTATLLVTAGLGVLLSGCFETPPAPVSSSGTGAQGTSTPCGTVPPVPAEDSSYAFLLTDRHGRPGRWDPRVPIGYSVDMTGGPSDAVSLVQGVIQEVSAASGLAFSFGGTYDSRAQPPPTALRIRWSSNPADFPAGESEPGHETSTSGTTPGGMIQIVAADIVMNSGQLERGLSTRGILILGLHHEVGHAVGLQHVNDRHQIMNPNAFQTQARNFAAGDRNGLWRLGPSAGCLS